MNTDAQRIAIAEACGWTIPDWCITKRRQRGEKERSLKGATPDFGSHPTVEGDLPDYLNSLDAMHEAVTAMAKKHGWQYSATFVNGRWSCGIYDPIPMHPKELGHAYGPEQCSTLAEAFLRTLGLWIES